MHHDDRLATPTVGRGEGVKIVGLVGPMGSGKSTAADVLVRERGFVSIGFADALKDLALRVNPRLYLFDEREDGFRLKDLVDDCGWEDAKKNREVRRFLQELGTGVRDIVGPDSWVDCWHVKMMDAYYDGVPGVVVPDVRFANEAQYLRHLNGGYWQTMLIRITRPGLDASDTHVSETEQLGIECDREIVNGTTAAQLCSDVLFGYDRWSS